MFDGGGGLLTEGFAIFNDIDGRSKQYQCATALHLLSVFCANNTFCIDRTLLASDHGKYLVDRISACDKQHLKRYIKFINQPHEGEKEITIKFYLIDKKMVSLADECIRHCLEGREFGSKGWLKNGGTGNNQTKTLSCDRS